ncbi:MAG: MFS transporter, partial [Pseudomonadota bacterium]
ATKVYDLATDLPMGWVTDRTRTPWGARRPYLVAAGLLTPAALAMLFAAPQSSAEVWILSALLLYATGYTLFNVPYLSMPAELSMDTHTRTRMVAWRSLFIAAGTLFGVAIAPYLVGALGGGGEAYRALGATMAVTVAFAFFGCVWLTAPARVPEAAPTTSPTFTQLRLLFGNPHFRVLLLIKISHLLGLAIGAGSLFFFFRFALGYDLQTLGYYGAATTFAWALSMPFWTRLTRSRGKRPGYFWATLLYTVMALTWLLADYREPLPLVLLRGALFGIASGGMLLMGNAMLQDIMDEDYRRSGERKNGLFAGSYSLVEKLSAGIGVQILGLILAVTGFDRAAATQPESAVQGIYVTAALIPAVLMFLSLFAIRRYGLSESSLAVKSSA